MNVLRVTKGGNAQAVIAPKAASAVSRKSETGREVLVSAIMAGQTPRFLRLPPPGGRCPVTGMSRGALNALLLPNKDNGFCPPVKSVSLKRRGAKRGLRLICADSLFAWLERHTEGGDTNHLLTEQNSASAETEVQS